LQNGSGSGICRLGESRATILPVIGSAT
jgi:hypothetical protein